MAPEWIDDARRRLLGLRRKSGAWGYRRTTAPAVEPTALAGLALLATDPVAGLEAARAAAGWLASIQGRDGALGVTDTLRAPGWATPFAALLWAALGGFAAERKAAMGWLLERRGSAVPREAEGPLGHDTMLVGWPWTEGAHSWVEPTALALLVLDREGKREHPRALEGVRVLRDRAIPSGGWNYGNRAVFGANLRALPAPTGLALLALAGAGAGAGAGGPDAVVAAAIDYLRPTLEQTRAPASLGWGLIGLRAWEAAPVSADARLASAFDRVASRGGDEASSLALLLLGAGAGSLDVLGVAPQKKRMKPDA